MFLSRGTYKWMDFGDRHVYLQLSEVKAQTKMGSFRLAGLVAVVTSQHSGSEKWQAESLAIR
jgi:hypothetical protein